MNNFINFLKLLSDETRLRILMLLTKKELCVCQLMGVLGISQPLISRNLSLLNSAGLLNERRDGKLIFYSVRKNILPSEGEILDLLKKHLKAEPAFINDLRSLKDCTEFQKRTGKCDMNTFFAFMKKRKKQKNTRR